MRELEGTPGAEPEFENTREVRGCVKWFNVVKGYGFVTPDDGSPDVFLHLSVLRQAGHDKLLPGATVVCAFGAALVVLWLLAPAARYRAAAAAAREPASVRDKETVR